MNDLIILAFAVIMLLAVVPMFLMSRAFKGAGRRKEEGGDTSVATAAVAGDGPPVKSKTGYGHDDSGSDGGGDGGDGGGGGD